jgi:RsiW-degrading membrane proteinase PrsW (M82 family)
MESVYVAVAFTAGLLPALFWLWFWLREDSYHPEPKTLITSAFITGMLIVPPVLYLEKEAMALYTDTSLVVVWVMIEEILKYSGALIVVLWNRAVDEPIDTIIYMISIALGFAALENALFIFNPLSSGEYTNALITGSFRFLGSTLLHTLASGTVGIFMALAFYKRDFIKIFLATFGLLVAIILHALFNLFIMDASGQTVLVVFMFVWIGIVLLILSFEIAKMIEKKHRLR